MFPSRSSQLSHATHIPFKTFHKVAWLSSLCRPDYRVSAHPPSHCIHLLFFLPKEPTLSTYTTTTHQNQIRALAAVNFSSNSLPYNTGIITLATAFASIFNYIYGLLKKCIFTIARDIYSSPRSTLNISRFLSRFSKGKTKVAKCVGVYSCNGPYRVYIFLYTMYVRQSICMASLGCAEKKRLRVGKWDVYDRGRQIEMLMGALKKVIRDDN